MKQFIILLAIAFLALPVTAQQTKSLFDQLTEKYADQDGFSASQLSKDMFDLYLKKKKVDEPSPVYDALKNLDNIIVISQSNYPVIPSENSQTPNAENETPIIHKTILDHYRKQNYTLFKTEKRMGEDVKVYLRKGGDNIESLALITNSKVATNLVELQGKLDLNTVAKLNEALNLRGLENLYKIDNSSNYGYVSAGRYFSEQRMDEVIARQREAAERRAQLTERQRQQIDKQAQYQAQKQLELTEKYREMAEKYHRQPIFLSYPGDTNTTYYLNGKKVKADKIKEIDKEQIESIEYTKPKKDDDKTTIKIKTK